MHKMKYKPLDHIALCAQYSIRIGTILEINKDRQVYLVKWEDNSLNAYTDKSLEHLEAIKLCPNTQNLNH